MVGDRQNNAIIGNFKRIVWYCRDLRGQGRNFISTQYLVHLTASAYLIDNSKHCLNSSSLKGTPARPLEFPKRKKDVEQM